MTDNTSQNEKNPYWSCDKMLSGTISTMIASSPEYWLELNLDGDKNCLFKPKITLPIAGNEYVFLCNHRGMEVLYESLAELECMGESRFFTRKGTNIFYVCTEHELATIADRCRAVAKNWNMTDFHCHPQF